MDQQDGECPIGLNACIRRGRSYFSFDAGCDYVAVRRREGFRREKEKQRRLDDVAKLVRLSDGPVYGKGEGQTKRSIKMVVTEDKKDGRIMVLASKRIDVPLIRVKGKWKSGTFAADDLRDNFESVRNSERARALFREAKHALDTDPAIRKKHEATIKRFRERKKG